MMITKTSFKRSLASVATLAMLLGAAGTASAQSYGSPQVQDDRAPGFEEPRRVPDGQSFDVVRAVLVERSSTGFHDVAPLRRLEYVLGRQQFVYLEMVNPDSVHSNGRLTANFEIAMELRDDNGRRVWQLDQPIRTSVHADGGEGQRITKAFVNVWVRFNELQSRRHYLSILVRDTKSGQESRREVYFDVAQGSRPGSPPSGPDSQQRSPHKN
ncbi:MAG: hypothetical protein AB7E70_02070 [Hyphomicrobiaceae bacterium]